MEEPELITGTAAGVPFLAVPPARADNAAGTVIVWHALDPPRSETAMQAALPLAGLQAWRVYLGLPMSGARLPEGGLDAYFQLGYEDAVLQQSEPIVFGAVEEFPPAFNELRERLGIRVPSLGLVGASAGALVALSALSELNESVRAVALVSPATRLASIVASNERRFDVTYPWSERSRSVAARLDFVARADDLAIRATPMLFVIGSLDDADTFRKPAEELRTALEQRGNSDARLVEIPGMGHAFAEEPGLEAAPQTSEAARVDDVVVKWFQQHGSQG
jgi:dienelactone hydrolase